MAISAVVKTKNDGTIQFSTSSRVLVVQYESGDLSISGIKHGQKGP